MNRMFGMSLLGLFVGAFSHAGYVVYQKPMSGTERVNCTRCLIDGIYDGSIDIVGKLEPISNVEIGNDQNNMIITTASQYKIDVRFLTVAGAKNAVKSLNNGKSIDISRCFSLVPATGKSNNVCPADGSGTCFGIEYKVCGPTTRAPLLNEIKGFSTYQNVHYSQNKTIYYQYKKFDNGGRP